MVESALRVVDPNVSVRVVHATRGRIGCSRIGIRRLRIATTVTGLAA